MCMAALQVFIVRFFFQVCVSSFVMHIRILMVRIRAPEKVTCEGIGYGMGAEMGVEMIGMILSPERVSVYYTLNKVMFNMIKDELI